MWMPSVQPPRDECVEEAALDWESLGRAIRECVLDVLASNVVLFAVSIDGEQIEQSDPDVDSE